MLSLRLALRNIIAHRHRSLIMFSALSSVSCFVFLFLAFSDGEMANFRDGLMALWQPPSHIIVRSNGLTQSIDENEDWKTLATKTLPNSSELLAELLEQPSVADAAIQMPKLDLDVLAAGQRYRGFGVRGIDPEHSWQLKNRIKMQSGRFLVTTDIPEAMLHFKTAESVPVRIGDTITLTGRDLFGQTVAQTVTVCGFFRPNLDNPNLESFVYLNQTAYDLISGFNPDESLEIALQLPEGADLTTALTSLRTWSAQNADRLGQLEFADYHEVYHLDLGVYGMMRVIYLIVSALIILVVSFGVISVVSVNLFDRKREIGTYYCLGSEKGFLTRLYTLEILILNAFSTAAGLAIGLLVRHIINAIGLETDDPGLQLVLGGSQFALGLDLSSVAYLVGLILGLSLITTLVTLRKRLKVAP